MLCAHEIDLENGALVRLAPVPLFFFRDPANAVKYSGISVKTTHHNIIACDGCRYFAALIVASLTGCSKENLLHEMFYEDHSEWFGQKALDPEILCIAKGSFKKPSGHADGIRASKSIIASLEAALWAFWAHETFEEGA